MKILKEYRLAAGLSQSQLAKKIGMSTNAYAMIERGLRSINKMQAVNFTKLFRALNVQPEELLKGDEERSEILFVSDDQRF